MTTLSQFSAQDSVLGYLYQVRVALLLSIRRLKKGTDFAVSLETIDDVTFETSGGKPKELLQTKHHKKRDAALTNASPDLWKSLRVWFESYDKDSIFDGTMLYLITTGKASEGSAAYYLRTDNRNVDFSLEKLEETARLTQNKTNAQAFAAFLKASPQERRKLIDCVFIIDSAPTIMDLESEIRTEISLAVDRTYHDLFLERLEGWWLQRSLKQLLDAEKGDRILAIEIDETMSDLRDQFKRDSLPIDKDLLGYDLDEDTEAAYARSKFVIQLEIIKTGKKRIAAAVRDYYRAFEQRSIWLRDELLMIGEIAQYDNRLIEEWELFFEAKKDNLCESSTEEMKQKAGRDVLEWAERTPFPIRKDVIQPFISRGSFHMLADELKVGWHPEYETITISQHESKENSL